jgi:predicted esterase
MVLFALLSFGAVPASAPTTQQAGLFQLQFNSRSAIGSVKEQARRFGWRLETLRTPKDEQDYELSKETFDVYVPKSYANDAAEKFGLLVWISPMQRGTPPKAWTDVLDKHKLIWIGAENSGNERAIWIRFGLAVDAATNMQQRYRIDSSRVYVSGMSGGGRCASMLGIAYPDIFTGGIYMCGTNFYKDIPAPAQPGETLRADQRRVYPRAMYPPPLKLLTMSKQHFHHVLLTGENDMNREPTQVLFEKAFKAEGFRHVDYIEVPGMGHQLPDAEWFEKSIVAVDADSAKR